MELRCGDWRKHGKRWIRFIVDFAKKLMGRPNCTVNGFAEMEVGRGSRRGKCVGKILKVLVLDDVFRNGRTNKTIMNGKIIIIILFNLSSFTISEANYRLTLGYHGIASFIYNYISSTLLNHFF